MVIGTEFQVFFKEINIDFFCLFNPHLTNEILYIIARNRQETLAICWMLEAIAKQHMNKKIISLDQCLFDETLDVFQNMGIAH
jgi:hypothetical protein